MKNWMFKSVAICAALLFVAGCSSDPPKAAAVNVDGAKAALKTTLEAWKAGKTIDSLGTGTPAIVAQDMDWIAGKKLSSYEVVGDGTPQDANLRVEVKLTLAGDPTEKRVFYIVGTDPKVTVFRAFE